MAGKGRPPQALTKARKAARKGDAEQFAWALLEDLIDGVREGKDTIIESKDAVQLVKQLLANKKNTPKADQDDDKNSNSMNEWLKQANARKTQIDTKKTL